MRVLNVFILSLCIVYLVICAVMYVRQDSLVFASSQVELEERDFDKIPALEKVFFDVDGAVLSGVMAHPVDEIEGQPKKLVIGFGGNAYDARKLAYYFADHFPQYYAVALNYRGYGESTGVSTQESVFSDAEKVYDEFVKKIGADEVYVLGYSLGGSVAAHLATKRDVDGVILLTAFDSLLTLAQADYPFLPVKALLKYPFPVVDLLNQVPEVPVALFHAGEDARIPEFSQKALSYNLPHLVLDITLQDVGHGSILTDDELVLWMETALVSF